MKKLILVIHACVLTLCAQAQSFVTVSNDPASTAMGGTGVSSAASGFSIYNNTASAALSTGKWQAAYAYSPYMWDFAGGNNLHTVAGYCKLGSKHTLAAGVRYFNKANMMLTGEEGESLGVAKPQDLSVEVGYAYKINALMSVSANVRFIHTDMDAPDAKGTAVGFDIGYYMHNKGLSLGVVLSNVGSQMEYGANTYDTPSWIKAGGSYEWTMSDKHSLTGAIQCDYNFQPDSEKGFSSGVGVEYAYKNLLFLRGGYRLANDLMGYNYATTGIGGNIGFANLNFTYIIAGSNAPINKTMLMSVGVNF